MIDTVINNGKIVTPGGVLSGGVAIDGEKIIAVGKDSNLPHAAERINAKGNYVIPGAIDAHFHMAWPDWPVEESCEKDTAAAAFGGVTTIIDRMTEAGSLVKAVNERRKICERFSYVDFHLQVPIFDDKQIAEIPKLFDMGVCGFKFYIPYKGVEVVPPMVGIDDGVVYMGFKKIAKLGYPARAQVHCENIEPGFKLREQLKREGRKDLAAWNEARPNFLEEEAIQSTTYFSRLTGCPLHIVHMSARESVNAVREAKNKGTDVVAEINPQYLSITDSGDYGILGKVNPPLRKKEDIEALWGGVEQGIINLVGSDHAPCAKKHKKNLWEAIVGFAGVETYVPTMMTWGVSTGRISIEKLVDLCSTNVAKVYGLYPRKGAIVPGADADIAMFDPKKEINVKAENLHHVSDFTPYEGMKLKGWPTLTMVRGKVILENRKLTGKKGYGKYVSYKGTK